MHPSTHPPEPPEPARPRRRLVVRLGLVAGSILAALVLLEIGARLLAHATQRERGLGYDPELGWHMLPGIVKRGGMWCDQVPARTNSHGWRDAEHPLERVPGRRRILALGDSFTFGHGVDYGDRFTEVLEAELDCEVVNMAACAFGTDQELLAWETEGVHFAPDLVLLTVFLGNDLEDIRLERSSGWAKPWFDLRDGELHLTPPRQDLLTALRTRSYLVEVALRPFERGDRIRQPAARWDGKDTFELFVALLRRLRDGVEEAGARLLVALVHPRPNVEAARPWSRIAEVVGALEQEEIDYVDTFDAFREAYGPELYLLGDGEEHWSAAGNRVMAEVMASTLQRLGW